MKTQEYNPETHQHTGELQYGSHRNNNYFKTQFHETTWEYRPKAHKQTEATLILNQIEICNQNSEI